VSKKDTNTSGNKRKSDKIDEYMVDKNLPEAIQKKLFIVTGISTDIPVDCIVIDNFHALYRNISYYNLFYL
jgi:GTP-sensing pleiotropic transcriptional regulator CodY